MADRADHRETRMKSAPKGSRRCADRVSIPTARRMVGRGVLTAPQHDRGIVNGTVGVPRPTDPPRFGGLMRESVRGILLRKPAFVAIGLFVGIVCFSCDRKP